MADAEFEDKEARAAMKDLIAGLDKSLTEINSRLDQLEKKVNGLDSRTFGLRRLGGKE